MPLAAAIASGLVAALLYLSVLTGSLGALILVYLVQLPLFAAGLSLGVKAMLVASGTATLVTAAAGGWQSGMFFLLAEALPVIVLAAQALRWQADEAGAVVWYPPGRLVLWLTAFGAASLLFGALALSGSPDGFQGTVRGFLAGQLGELLSDPAGGAAEQAQRADAVAGALTGFFPAMAVSSWLVMTTINAVLAQGALTRFALNRRPAPDLAELVLPRWLAALLAAALLIAELAGGDLAYLAGNLAPVLVLPYVFAGLAVLHAVVRRHAGRLFILIPAYATLLLGWPVLLVAACGMIDQWFGLRSRFAAIPPQQGDL